MKKKTVAFTLIELLINIVIIGILSAVGIAGYVNFADKATNAKETAELRDEITNLLVLRLDYDAGDATAQELMAGEISVIEKVMILARKKQGKNLIDITGNTCSDCICRGHDFIPPVTPQAQTCIDTWDMLADIFKDATDLNVSFIQTDPWGSPYLIDENEGEWSNNYCRRDNIFSAGPDQYHEAGGAGDGIQVSLAFYDVEQCGE